MRFHQRVTGAIAVTLAAVFFVPMIGAENVTENPVIEPVPKAEPIPAEPIPAEPIPAEPIPAEPIPTADPVSDDGKIPAPKPWPAVKTVPTAEPVPVAEPVSAAEEESNAASVPAVEMIVAPGTALAAEPVPVAESAPDSKMVPVAEPVEDAEGVPSIEPTTIVEAVPMGDSESSIEMAQIAEPGFSFESILAAESEPDAAANPYTEENLALGPPWVEGAAEEDTMTLREMFLQNHREQLEIYDLNHDNVISEEEWKAANEDDLARGEKFFVVDKNDDGAIDENEAVGFLMDRVSLSSTYIDATSDETTDITRGDIKEAAPSELRVTLFSIPLGD